MEIESRETNNKIDFDNQLKKDLATLTDTSSLTTSLISTIGNFKYKNPFSGIPLFSIDIDISNYLGMETTNEICKSILKDKSNQS